MSWRLRDHLRFSLSFCKCNASRKKKRGLGEEYLEDTAMEFEATAEKFQRVARPIV